MKTKILRNSSVALLAQFVAIIYGFVLPRMILGHFGSEINGLTQSIKQFLGVIGFLDMGVGQVVRSALYRPLADKDHLQLSRVMASGTKFYRRLAYMMIAYVAILMCVYPYVAEQNFGWLYTATLIAAMAISSFAQYYFGITNEQLLHADQCGYIIYSLQIISYLLNLAACVWMINVGCSIQQVKLAASLIFLIRPLVIQIYIQRHYQIDRKIRYTSEPIAQKWNGVAQHVSAVVLDGTDTIVLTLMSTLSNVSVYSVYYMVITSLQQFYQSTTAGIQSAAGALWAKQDAEEIGRMFSQVEFLLHSAVVFMFSCAGMLIVPFVRVYTYGLSDANYIQPLFAALLVIAYGIRSLRTPYNIWILAAGHYKQTQVCHITAAAINLIISVFAVSQWGLVGVAVGTLIAMVYQTLWMAVYCYKNLINRSLNKLAKQCFIDILSAGFVCLLSFKMDIRQINYWSWILMAVKVAAISLVTMAFVVFIFRREYFLKAWRHFDIRKS